MIALERIAEVLKNHQKEDGISEVEVTSNGEVCSYRQSRIDPNRPYTLYIVSTEEGSVLQIVVTPIMKIHRDSNMYRTLANFNLGLPCGSVGAGGDGEIVLKINHFCEDNDDDPSPNVIERLLDQGIKYLRNLEKVLLYEAMVEAGVPRPRASRTVRTLLVQGHRSPTGD